ncbi:MAG: beta-glucosidase BglX [Neisseriaceae bacterium]|nr:MAG: beta-glucosidase BglX [Neisseriaceae bacterium]
MSNIEKEIAELAHPELPNHNDEECLALAEKLMSQMTLKEKFGQLFQLAPSNANIEGLQWQETNDFNDLIKQGLVGSILSVADIKEIYQLQKTAVTQSRLGIPLFFGYDIIHGCHTGFPINLAMACSFEPKLIERVAQVMAFEASHNGITMTFSPMVDLVRDPRWGRVMESNGEDPYLNKLMGQAYVKGFQQDSLSSYNSIASCCKHFAAYGMVEAGREYNTVDMSERELRQYHLPGYKACLDAGASSIMTSFNIYNGVPATANKFLLRDILRNEWGYSGFTISDYTSSYEMLDHKTSANEREVAKQSILAGLDHEMVSTTYIKYLEELITANEVNEALINEACLRMLTFKYKSGLFDNPYKNIYANVDQYYLTNNSRQLAKEAAIKSIVLLKNDNQTLPLKPTTKIALVGPLGKTNELVGAWGGLVKNESCVTVYEGLVNQFGQANVQFAEGCNINDNDSSLFEQAYEVAKNSDVIVLAIGESQTMSGEAKSRAYLNIPGVQNELARKLKSLGKPIIAIVFAGRPLELEWYQNNVDAILFAWFLGSETGDSIADIVSGKANPSAKLAMSFPYTVGQVPVYYNQYKTGRPSATGKYSEFRSCYIDVPNYPLYSFGYGLSYSKFEYSNLQLSKKQISGKEKLVAKVTLTNTSSIDGVEVAQLYIECKSFSVVRPVRELKAIQKISLKAHESKELTFEIGANDLAYYNIDMEFTPEDTDYIIYIGGCSNANISDNFSYNS